MWPHISICTRKAKGKVELSRDQDVSQSNGPILKRCGDLRVYYKSALPEASLWLAAGEWVTELAVSSCSCSSSLWYHGRRSVTWIVTMVLNCELWVACCELWCHGKRSITCGLWQWFPIVQWKMSRLKLCDMMWMWMTIVSWPFKWESNYRPFLCAVAKMLWICV